MRLTAQAAALLSRLTETHPADVDRWQAWAARIARAYGRASVSKADIEAAMHCAGEEFLPDAPNGGNVDNGR